MKLKTNAIAILAAIAGLLTSCAKENTPAQTEPGTAAPATRSAERIKNAVYVEVKDVNPLNAGSYFYEDGTPFYDIVIIFAANINGYDGEAILHFNNDITHLLADPDKYIRPLQEKGIKVVLNILGNHTGLGFANLTDRQVESFARKLAWAAEYYELDGIDFSDSWAKYGQNGYPHANTASYGKLIKELRSLMPDKLISIFDWGHSSYLDAQAQACLDYAWSGYYTPFYLYTPRMAGFPLEKYAGLAFDAKNLTTMHMSYLAANSAQSVTRGFGGILTYDLRKTDVSRYLDIIGRASSGLQVSYDGNVYERDWSWGPTTDI